MAAEIHYGDVGTTFILTITDQDGSAVDVSGASTKQIKFEKPSGADVTQTADFTSDGTDGKIEYTTVADDLNETGFWKIQGKVTIATGTWHSDITRKFVYANLS